MFTTCSNPKDSEPHEVDDEDRTEDFEEVALYVYSFPVSFHMRLVVQVIPEDDDTLFKHPRRAWPPATVIAYRMRCSPAALRTFSS